VQHASYLVRLQTMQMLLLILVRLEEAITALSSVSALLSSGTAHASGGRGRGCMRATADTAVTIAWMLHACMAHACLAMQCNAAPGQSSAHEVLSSDNSFSRISTLS
jgi:hypothetical protein